MFGAQQSTDEGNGMQDQRVAIVTGAGSGIGAASAARLAADGFSVLCADVAADGASRVADAIGADGGTAMAITCDVSDPASAAALTTTALDAYGRLDVVANIAGVGRFVESHTAPLHEWQRTLAVNLTGVFLVSQAALPHLIETGGNIVNMASVAGLKGQPFSAAYCASKGGVIALTKALAVEYGGRGVRVNCICPGGVDTAILAGFVPPEGADLSALARMGSLVETERLIRSEEIAEMVAYLASDRAAVVTGAAMVLDAGMTA